MTAKTELMQAHEAMAAVLDAKFSTLPEWKAFRAIDRALLALETESTTRENSTPAAPRPRIRLNGHVAGKAVLHRAHRHGPPGAGEADSNAAANGIHWCAADARHRRRASKSHRNIYLKQKPTFQKRAVGRRSRMVVC